MTNQAEPCYLRVIPYRGSHTDSPRYVCEFGERVVYEGFDAARAHVEDCAALMDTLSRCEYHIEIVGVRGGFRRLPWKVSDQVWEIAREDRLQNSIGARLARGEAVAI